MELGVMTEATPKGLQDAWSDAAYVRPVMTRQALAFTCPRAQCMHEWDCAFTVYYPAMNAERNKCERRIYCKRNGESKFQKSGPGQLSQCRRTEFVLLF
jgi:hypothetical protein